MIPWYVALSKSLDYVLCEFLEVLCKHVLVSKGYKRQNVLFSVVGRLLLSRLGGHYPVALGNGLL